MSYILDALKKAERDRRLRRVPSLGTIHTPAERKRRHLWPWIGGGAVAVNVVALALLFGVTREVGPPAGAPQASAPRVVATAGAPGDPAGAAATNAANPVPGGPPGTGSVPIAGTPPPSAPAHPAASSASPTAPGRAVGAIAEHGSGGATSPRALQARPTPARGTGAARDDALHPRAEAAPASRSGAHDAGAAAGSVRGGDTESAADAGKRGGRVFGSRSSDLKLEVLVYADDPAERSAWINGQRYVEGQRVQGRLVIEKITPDAVVLGGEGPRVVLRQ
ncbi:MAG: general secretion pathway protein GspB [Candidatus Rokubacteria bacterium]|nr:general secretion pathway protein GspB [Candidatus Rokubacteria bacterium]